jgi:phospholipase C
MLRWPACQKENPGEKGESMGKLGIKVVALFTLLGTSVAHGQTYQKPPTFNHIVIIVQENRSTDNLFGANPSQTPTQCGNPDPFEPGVDITNGGPINFTTPPSVICSQQLSNMLSGGGNHTHTDWTNQYDNGLLDGACYSGSKPACSSQNNPPYPPYTYVAKSVVQPYFDIATNYGFANYMFQTSEGPSFPAHQFIFGGTSAPVWPSFSNYYQYFVSENPSSSSSGCPATTGYPDWIDPSGTELTDPIPTECYDRNTLVTYQDSRGMVHDRGITWNYYAQNPGSIWDAPEADPQTCYGQSRAPFGNPPCSGKEFNNVILESKVQLTSAPILKNIEDCKLAQLSFVTPDEAWSDHPGGKDQSLGPSWVADIVNAIGSSYGNSHHKCDYWHKDPTAIFIVWDDWGGFYDHVPPPTIYTGTQSRGGWICNAPNGWGCGYTYGFRVPLLVVSEYTSAGTVSGPVKTFPVNYPPPAEWTHDFGSILAFIENNFSPKLGPIAPQGFSYADQNTLDSNNGKYVPLWEFFLGPQRPFTPINSQYSADYFMNYYTNNPGPVSPDEGADDE